MLLQEQQCYKNNFLCGWFCSIMCKGIQYIWPRNWPCFHSDDCFWLFWLMHVNLLSETQHHWTGLKTHTPEADHTKAHTYASQNLHTAIKNMKCRVTCFPSKWYLTLFFFFLEEENTQPSHHQWVSSRKCGNRSLVNPWMIRHYS